MASVDSPAPLAGKVAIVTGSSRGIGRAIALHLASLGARLVVNYTSSSSAADLVAAEINKTSPSHAVAVRADVSKAEDVKALFDSAEAAFGTKAHILVCSAGVMDSKYPTLADTTEEDYDRTFAINTKGTFLCCQEAARRLAHGGGGRIITFSSSLVGTSTPTYCAYTASKAAVEAMTKILAKELKGTRITANCLAPGPVATDLFYAGTTEEVIRHLAEMNPMGRLGETKDVTPVVGFLTSDAGEWINGQVIRVNGGYV